MAPMSEIDFATQWSAIPLIVLVVGLFAWLKLGQRKSKDAECQLEDELVSANAKLGQLTKRWSFILQKLLENGPMICGGIIVYFGGPLWFSMICFFCSLAALAFYNMIDMRAEKRFEKSRQGR